MRKRSVFLVGIFDDEGERLAEALVAVIRLLVAVAACDGAHLKEADAQYGVIRKVDDKLADEREREGLRFAAGGIGEVVIRHPLRNGFGLGGVVADVGNGAAGAVRRFERHALEQLIRALVFKAGAADGRTGQRAERERTERGSSGIRRELILPFAARLAHVGDRDKEAAG